MEYIAIPKADFIKYFKIIEAKKRKIKAVKNEITIKKKLKRKRKKSLSPTLIPAQQTVQSQQAFDQIYEDLSQPGVFTEKIKKYLYSNVTHSLHKPRKKQFNRRQIIPHYPSQIVQIDLIDIQQISGSNSNYKYLLLFIDC
jgi:hypothetical protein